MHDRQEAGAKVTLRVVGQPTGIGQYWSERIQQMLETGTRDRAVLPSERSLDVRFHEFMADDIATVRRIYAVADQPFDRDVEAAMNQFITEHPRGRHGGVRYDLEGDFGIDPGALRAAMRDYVARFGVEEER